MKTNSHCDWLEKELSNLEILNTFAAKFPSEVSKMRAEESDKLDYIDEYRRRGEEEGFAPNWNYFIELWEKRNESSSDMAELLAEVKGVAFDEALAWIEDY